MAKYRSLISDRDVEAVQWWPPEDLRHPHTTRGLRVGMSLMADGVTPSYGVATPLGIVELDGGDYIIINGQERWVETASDFEAGHVLIVESRP